MAVANVCDVNPLNRAVRHGPGDSKEDPEIGLRNTQVTACECVGNA